MSLQRICQFSVDAIRKLGVRHSSAFRYYQYLREPQPDDIRTTVGGVPIIKPPKPTLTGVEESRDPEEWKAVLELLPSPIVPLPPKHVSYPTPSGWFPPKEATAEERYRVRRTRFHNFPIYKLSLNGGNRLFTVITKVQGDIWAFDEDLRRFLTGQTGKTTYTRVNEVCCKIWVRGIQLEAVAEFLKQKGF